MTSTPALDRRGRVVLDADGYPQETLSWETRPPRGLHGNEDGVDMPDLRRGGRPRGGISVVGTREYDEAVTDYIRALCRLMGEGRATEDTNKTEATALVASVLGVRTPVRQPWAEAWSRWKNAGRPDNFDAVTPITPIDPFTTD